MFSFRFVVVALGLLLAGAALAQDAPPVAIRATIEAISSDGATLDVRTRAGERLSVRLKEPRAIIAVVAAKLADVKPGLFVGVAALPDAAGVQHALELHIFPEAMRGTGEGFRPFDLAPGSTMTNGAITAMVDSVTGPSLKVAYKGGEQTIVVDPATPIVAFAPGDPSELKVGAAIIVRGVKAADGVYEAPRILVGRDGLVPPL
jgi:hypothetical protein